MSDERAQGAEYIARSYAPRATAAVGRALAFVMASCPLRASRSRLPVQLIGLSVASTSGSQFRCGCAHAITLAVTNPRLPRSFSYNVRDIRVTNVVSRHCVALH